MNYLGHFLLTHLLYPRLAASGTKHRPSRVINVSSDGHRQSSADFHILFFLISLYGYRFTLWLGQDVDHPQFGYASWAYQGVGAFHRLYGQSKLAQIYHARQV